MQTSTVFILLINLAILVTFSSTKPAFEVGKEADQNSQEILDLEQEARSNEVDESGRYKRRVSNLFLALKKVARNKLKKEKKAKQEENLTKGRSSVEDDESARSKR